MSIRKNAAPGRTGSGARKAHQPSSFTPEDGPPEHETYYVRVLFDGSEETTALEPRGLKTLLVERIGDWEFTRTRTVQHGSGSEAWFMSVPPKGAGWECCDTSSDKWTGYRRKAVERHGT